MNRLVLLPAVDVAAGQAVQLVQGVAGTERRFGDPIAAAQRWADAGAEWLHLVDLDAAFGRGSNAEILAEVVDAMDVHVKVQLSGGIRDDESLERALGTGCARINLGTAALEQPQWCERVIAEHGDRIAVSLDVKGTTLAARGWTETGGDVYETLRRLDQAGCARFVVTDVAADGMLSGPNYDLLNAICARTNRHLIASGGITSLEDVARLAAMVGDGVEGAIIGTALYVGRFTLADALATAATAGPDLDTDLLNDTASLINDAASETAVAGLNETAQEELRP